MGGGFPVSLYCYYYCGCGPGSSVGIATDYGLDGPGIKSWWGGQIFRPSRPALGPTHPLVQWVLGLSRGVKCGRGVTLTPHPLLAPRSWKTPPPLGHNPACNGVTLFLLLWMILSVPTRVERREAVTNYSGPGSE